MVKSFKGNYYVERALIRIDPDGTVSCSVKEYAPTDAELVEMKAALQGVEFPRIIRARNLNSLKVDRGAVVYEFRDLKTGEIIMAQERRINPDGTKRYVPWVLLSTGDWAMMEPDGALPFWKPAERRGSRIMIHEGAKAAKAAAELPADHPWAKEMSQWEHWGMIGGALAPHRTDYDELKAAAPTEVVYVCDNDQAGTAALQKVSKAWGKSMKGVVFGGLFPGAWDVADPLPPNLFAPGGRFIGPAISELMEPATWATEVLPPPDGKGRGLTVIRPEFCEEWLHCVTPEAFIHRDWPNRVYSAAEFNSKVAPFSHVDETARLIRKDFGSKAAVMKYNPGQEPGLYGGASEGQYINTYCPSRIAPEPGDPKPWIEFMTTLIPDPKDRHEALRWCATLIARPGVRMLYGMLLISEMQGVGKGTLGEKILAPLVGDINVSYPSEQEIVESNFNYWLAHKRLAVVHEIYAGHSSKAYNRLKSAITDRYVTVQKKYQPNYEIESWIHILACSNSTRAIKMSMDDRRWFVPKLSEEKRPASYWAGFNRWLQEEGGLAIIAHWADTFVHQHGAVQKGDSAPWSTLKRDIVEDGYSPGQALVAQALNDLKRRVIDDELKPDLFLLDTDLVRLIQDTLYEGRHNDRLERPATVRAVAKAQGWAIGETRAQVRNWGPGAVGARVIALDPAIAAMAPADLGGEKAAKPRRPFDLRAAGPSM